VVPLHKRLFCELFIGTWFWNHLHNLAFSSRRPRFRIRFGFSCGSGSGFKSRFCSGSRPFLVQKFLRMFRWPDFFFKNAILDLHWGISDLQKKPWCYTKRLLAKFFSFLGLIFWCKTGSRDTGTFMSIPPTSIIDRHDGDREKKMQSIFHLFMLSVLWMSVVELSDLVVHPSGRLCAGWWRASMAARGRSPSGRISSKKWR